MAVDFGAIAGRENRGFLHVPRPDQVAERLGERVGRERNPLPHLDRRGLVVESERVKRHGRCWGPPLTD